MSVSKKITGAEPAEAHTSANSVNNSSEIKIGMKAFLLSIVIILLLMMISGVLTLIMPAGVYDRITEDGRTLVVDGSYREIARPNYPMWRWFTAPVEILFAPDNITVIVLIIFIMAVGGSIAILEQANVMKELINLLVRRFEKNKYMLIALMILFFMVCTSFIGIYEGMVPMIIFIIPIAISLGWDSLTGLGISLLPLAFGFASSVTNPFTIAVAQKIADLPLFSGALFRIVFFITVYFIVTFFVIHHAKKVEAKPSLSPSFAEDEILRARMKAYQQIQNDTERCGNAHYKKALIWFVCCVGIAMIIVISTARIPGLSNLAFPVMTLLFLAGGIGGGLFAKLGGKGTVKSFLKGSLNLLPGVVLVLMSYSVKHIITEGKIMDTILFTASEMIRKSPPMTAAFLIYATTLAMNFFIGSASAKAFLMMPILTPLADLVGITRQTAVLAFDFGDGFSNMIFPTNALLLIALSFTVVGYPKWMRWTWKLQIIILLVTSVFLAIAAAIRFGPF